VLDVPVAAGDGIVDAELVATRGARGVALRGRRHLGAGVEQMVSAVAVWVVVVARLVVAGTAACTQAMHVGLVRVLH
jgi:hypothetical protein